MGQRVEPGRRAILLGSAGTAAAIVAGQAAAGIFMLMLARELPPSEFGEFAILYTVGAALGGVLDFGSSQRKSRDLAQGTGLSSFASWIWRRAALQIPIVLAVAFAAWLVLGRDTSSVVVVALISQGVTYPVSLGCTGAIRALRSPALGTWLVAVGNGFMVLVVVLAPSDELVVAAAFGVSASWLISAGLAYLLTPPLVHADRVAWAGNPWRGSASFGFFGLAVALQGLQLAIVGMIAGPTEAGELAAVSRWAQPVYLMTAALAVQTFPALAAAQDSGAARRVLKPVWAVSALGLVIGAGLVLTAPLLVDRLLGSEYDASIVLLQAASLAALPVLLTQPLATYLQARGQEKVTAFATSLLLSLALVMTAIGATWIGALAAPVASGIANLLLLVVLVRLFRSSEGASTSVSSPKSR